MLPTTSALKPPSPIRRGLNSQLWATGTALVVLALATEKAGAEAASRSHPSMRALPAAASRPIGKGPSFFVDPVKGNDRQEGTEQKPWKTVNRALKQQQGGPLKPGDTLCLRGGTYYECVTVAVSGTAEKPITIRSYPGELAIVDGGLREFHEDPANAWEPFSQGAGGGISFDQALCLWRRLR